MLFGLVFPFALFLLLFVFLTILDLRLQINLYGLIHNHWAVNIGLLFIIVIILRILGVYFEVVLHLFLVIGVFLLEFAVFGVLLHVSVFTSILTEVKDFLDMQEVLSDANIFEIVDQFGHKSPSVAWIPTSHVDGAEGIVSWGFDVAVCPQPEKQLNSTESKADKINKGVQVEAVEEWPETPGGIGKHVHKEQQETRRIWGLSQIDKLWNLAQWGYL